MKKNTTEWEKRFANCVSTKGLTWNQTQSAGEDVEHQELSSGAGGDAYGAATLGDSLAVSYKTARTRTVCSVVMLLRIYPKELKICIHIKPACNLHCFVHDRYKLEATKMIFSEGMDKPRNSMKWTTIQGHKGTSYCFTQEHG